MMEKKCEKIYVAGHRGMVGSAIVRELQRQGYTNIVTRTHKDAGSDPSGCSGEVFRCRKAGVCVSRSCQSRRHCGKPECTG